MGKTRRTKRNASQTLSEKKSRDASREGCRNLIIVGAFCVLGWISLVLIAEHAKSRTVQEKTEKDAGIPAIRKKLLDWEMPGLSFPPSVVLDVAPKRPSFRDLSPLAYEKTPKGRVPTRTSLFARIEELIFNHPSPEISIELRDLSAEKKLSFVVQPEAGWRFIARFQVMPPGALSEERGWQPVIFFSEESLEGLHGEDAEVLMLALSHEYQHYKQFRGAVEGSVYRLTFTFRRDLSRVAPELCAAHWEQELDANDRTCRLAAYWGSPLAFFPACLKMMDSPHFKNAVFLAHVSGWDDEYLKDCGETWARLAGHPDYN